MNPVVLGLLKLPKAIKFALSLSEIFFLAKHLDYPSYLQ